MGWGTHYNEPDNSCPLLDRIIDFVGDAMKEPEEVEFHLKDVEDYANDVRTIASTLREQRRYFESEVERLEQELEETKDECSRLRGQLEESAHA